MEVVMEVEESLTEDYEGVVERAMIDGGNSFLTKGLFSMSCEAHTADSWAEAK